MLEVVRSSNELIPVLAILGVLAFIGFCVWAITRRTIEPWWRKYPKPSKQKKIARDQIRAFKERESCPEAFDPNNPLYQPMPVQQFHLDDITKIAKAVAAAVGVPQLSKEEEHHVD